MNNAIYFDNAATTRVRDEVFEQMSKYFSNQFGNPSSIYKIARENKKAVEQSREKIAAAINADKNEIFFYGRRLRGR